MIKEKAELQFEKDIIDQLQNLGGTKQWEYLPHVKTTEQLWSNFKQILERNNQDSLERKPLSENEFAQVK